MVAWITGILGVVVLGVLLDTLSPSGEMQRFIKGIFALIAVFVIIAPLPKLLSAEFQLNSDAAAVDSSYLEEVYKARVELLESAAEAELLEGGIKNASVTIAVDCYSQSMQITLVTVNLQNAVIDKNNPHIFTSEEIVERLSTILSVNGGKIIII